MKKIFLIISALVFLVLGFSNNLILAEDDLNDSDINENQMNLTTDDDSDDFISDETEDELELNEDVGGGKIAWKNMRLWFTFNQEKKIEREMELARLRLIQAKIAAKNNNSYAMEKALEAHEKILERARLRLDSIKDSDKIRDTNSSALKLVGLERAIQIHEKRIEYMNNLLENSNLTEQQREKIENKLSKVEGVTSKLTELNNKRIEKVKSKIMSNSNLTEEQADRIIQDRKDKIKEQVREKIKERRGNLRE